MKSAKISHGSNINYLWTSRHERTDCIKVSLSWPPRWIPPVIRGHVAFKNGTRRALIFAFLPSFEHRISLEKEKYLAYYRPVCNPGISLDLWGKAYHLCRIQRGGGEEEVIKIFESLGNFALQGKDFYGNLYFSVYDNFVM